MRSSFFGLNVAATGIIASQRQLDLVNHNMANSATTGYSRQMAVQSASRAFPLYNGTGMIGTGTLISSIVRIRDLYLDVKYWNENARLGEWETKNSVIKDMEAKLNEPSDHGFNAAINGFYDAMETLSKNPEDAALKKVVAEMGNVLTSYFNNLATHYEQLQSELNQRVYSKVQEVNSLGMQIETLNRQIYINEVDGNNANDLRDQRDLLVDRLSMIVNVEAYEISYGTRSDGKEDLHYFVTISGIPFVSHFNERGKSNVNLMEAYEREHNMNEEDIPNLYDLRFKDGNRAVIKSGEMRGLLDLRDGKDGVAVDPKYGAANLGTGNTPLFKGIPYYQAKLNQFVRTFAMAFNEGFVFGGFTTSLDFSGFSTTAELQAYLDANLVYIGDGTGHAGGHQVGSSPGDPPSGIRFFTLKGDGRKAVTTDFFLNDNGQIGQMPNDVNSPEYIAAVIERYKNVTAKNFSVSWDVLDDPTLISTMDSPGEVGNNRVLLALLNQRNDIHLFTEGKTEDFMKSLIGGMGIDSQKCAMFLSSQRLMMNQLTNKRLSISGVSEIEESANMVRFLNVFNSSAKMVQVFNEVYDTLINRLGLM